MEFITVNGVTINCAFSGEQTNPALVFVNSLGSDLRIWDAVIPYFEDRYYVLRYDKRGHGLSDSPPGPYSIRDHMADLTGLLDELGLEKVVLIGVSVGGMISLDFTAVNPQRVRALVLCDTAAKLGTAEYWNERIQNIETKGMEAMTEVILSRWFASDFAQRQPATYQGYTNLLSRTDVNGYVATCAALRDADLRSVVADIAQPVLVLCGAEDSATPPELVSGLAQGFSHGRFQLISKAGHTPSVENPTEMAAVLTEFLQENTNV